MTKPTQTLGSFCALKEHRYLASFLTTREMWDSTGLVLVPTQYIHGIINKHIPLLSASSLRAQEDESLLSNLPIPRLQLISPMRPVQKPQHSIVQVKLLMMRVVHLSASTEEIKPAVHSRRLDQLQRDKRPERQDMRVQNLPRQRDGQHIRHKMLNRVGELRSERDGRHEAVVLLVDGRIKPRRVQEAVAVVEHNLAHEQAEDDVSCHFGERGERGGNAERGFSALDEVEEREVEACGEGLVAGDDFEAVGDFCGRWLLGGWLELVACGEAGEENVDGEVEESCEPEKDCLDEERATEFDGGG